MGYPAGLNVLERRGTTPGAPAVVLVHGTLDRGDSFGRTIRRLPDLTTVAYDRRGYQGSRAAGVVGLGGHIEDLLQILSEVRSRGASRVVAVGHSVGGDVVVGAALAAPTAVDALGAFEPPMPWLGFRRAPKDEEPERRASEPKDPGDEAEAFFRRMVSAAAWERLTDAGKAGRRADGPALVADFMSLRGQAPFDVTNLSVPAVFGMGGPDTAAHNREVVEWIGEHVLGATLYEIQGAQHGAHLSHPDNFASFVRAVLGRIPPA